MTTLDEYQRHAVQRIQSSKTNIRLRATAGAGKTTVLVEGIAQLIEGGTNPESIMAVTFTAAAGKELQERLVKRCPAALRAHVGTFHSLGLKQLQALDTTRWAMSRCCDVQSETPKSKDIWRAILDWSRDGIPGLPGAKSLNCLDNPMMLNDYMLEADCIRSEGVEVLDQLGEVDKVVYNAALKQEKAVFLNRLADAMVMYAQAKRALKAFDFQDVLYEWLLAINEYRLVPFYTHVFVDEAQDNSGIQLKLASALAVGGRLFLIGDPSQAIYQWRGASPETFNSLALEDIDLPYNYRSAAPIVQAGNVLTDKMATKLEALVGAKHKGEIRPLQAEDGLQEAATVASEIQALLQERVKPSEIAILVRTQSAAGIFEGELTRLKIPVRREGGTPFWERWDVLSFVAYAILYEHDAFPALEKIYNTPKRFLSREFLQRTNDAQQKGAHLCLAIRQAAQALNQQTRDRAVSLAQSIEQRRKLTFSEAMDDIASLLSRNQKSSERDISDDRTAVPQAVAQIAKGLGSVGNLVAYADMSAAGIRAVDKKTHAPAVLLTTVHRAKAREWEYVYVSMPSGIFPHQKASSPHRLEEERRLAYVAVTRGKRSVTVSWPSMQADGGRIVGPGMFAREIFGIEDKKK